MSNDTDTAPDRIDPDTTEGAAIMSLFTTVKVLEEGDGGWPGAEVVPALERWFIELGIDPGHQPDAVAEELRSGRRRWTVFGLRDNTRCGATQIAAVLRGEISAYDDDTGDETAQRVGELVLASTPEEAEELAYELFEAARDAD
ncbi:hypothetical protein LZ318_30850 [Saccharopolyspora indica]|uniref:hypothetical protein n=1 Tax=Saccharopolyspora indica TaxID=1229659 RepID=UPI0022EA94F2|nr:hypothetical protein [Saccharopolyspora indica]MDA3644368.1 hypothetical protein [Saccharopolyspora indica]